MIHPTVLRVQPLYEKSGPRKISVNQSAEHNARTGGDIIHIDSARTSLNKTMLGSGDILKDVTPCLNQHPRASKNGPIAGEILITANKEFFRKLSEDERCKWANDSLAWALTEFDENKKGKVVSCIWHRDEDAEHLHLVIVPIVECISGNQHYKKTVTKINYAGVLGKPRGGEKGIPPSERLWGKKQTSYSSFMSEKGHQLVRGVKNRQLRTNKSPAQFRKEIADYFNSIAKEIIKTPDNGNISKKKAIQYIKSNVYSRVKDSEQRIAELENRTEALEQTIEATAKTLGCETASNLAQHALNLAWGLNVMKTTPQEVAKGGRRVRKQIKAERENKKEKDDVKNNNHDSESALKQVRRTNGQRKTPEERKAARLVQKQVAEQDRALNRTTHQILHLDKEIYHDKYSNRQSESAWRTNYAQKTSDLPVQPSQQRYVPS